MSIGLKNKGQGAVYQLLDSGSMELWEDFYMMTLCKYGADIPDILWYEDLEQMGVCDSQ